MFVVEVAYVNDKRNVQRCGTIKNVAHNFSCGDNVIRKTIFPLSRRTGNIPIINNKDWIDNF